LLEEALILAQIIFITIILTADNAIIIGVISANFVPKNKKQIILWGVSGALIFKIIFALFATYLFKFYFIKILGGLLLIWIVNDLRKDLFEIKKIKSPTKKSKEPSFIQSVYKVLFADIMISFDNVIGVVGASKGNFGFMTYSFCRFNRSISNISCKLYSKTLMDCICWFSFYFIGRTSISNWRFSRSRDSINKSAI
jgi:YjbE family integral membrane protein